MNSLLYLVFIGVVVAVPLGQRPLSEEDWLQICCQDNDKNDDGAISYREFTPFVLAVLNLDKKDLQRVFLTADEDKNSDLDGSECPVVRRLLKDIMEKRISEYKRKYDADGDGRINQEEVRKLAFNEFGVEANDADSVFEKTHNNHGAEVNHSEWTDLLLELREKAIKQAGGQTSKWSNGKKKQPTYDEVRKNLNADISSVQFKTIFKQVDFDENMRLSPVEFLALMDIMRRDPEGPIIDRTRREAVQAASEEQDKSEIEIDAGTALKLSQRFGNMSGGQKGPSLDFDAVTVPYNDPNFE